MGLMRLSYPGRTVIIAIVLVGVTSLPTKAFPGPQERVTIPSGQTKQSSNRQPTSTPAKQVGMLIEYRNAQYGFCFSLREVGNDIRSWLIGGKVTLIQMAMWLSSKVPSFLSDIRGGREPTRGKTSPSWFSPMLSGAPFKMMSFTLVRRP